MVFPTGLALSIALSLSSVAQGYVIKVNDHNGPAKSYEVRSSNLTAEEFLSSRDIVHFRREIEERESACAANTQVDYYYKIIGDGNPHQNFKIAQVENTIVGCPGSVATGESHTFGWSIGGGFNPGVEKYDFANVGFTVGESDTKTVTETFQCHDDMTEVCALHYTAVTAITVEFWSTTRDCNIVNDNDLGQGVVYLPNDNGIGSVMARGVNYGNDNIIQCRGTAAREVDFFCGPKGGPEFWDNTGDGPYAEAYMAALDPPDCAVPIEAMHFNDK